MSLPVGVETSDHQPEEPVSGLEVRARTGTQRDMELVAQEQVLDHKVVPLTEEGGQSREEDAQEFKHPGGVADRAGRSLPSFSQRSSPSDHLTLGCAAREDGATASRN